MLRVVRPEAVQTFAEGHTDGLWSCLRNMLGVTLDTNPTVRDIATMPLSLGGMGLRNAVRTSPAAFWTSWSDCFSMVRERHPEIATTILRRMGNPMAPPTLHERLQANRLELQGLTHRLGKPLRMASVHHTVTQTTLSPGISVTGGSTKLLQEWNASTEKSLCPS